MMHLSQERFSRQQNTKRGVKPTFPHSQVIIKLPYNRSADIEQIEGREEVRSSLLWTSATQILDYIFQLCQFFSYT